MEKSSRLTSLLRCYRPSPPEASERHFVSQKTYGHSGCFSSLANLYSLKMPKSSSVIKIVRVSPYLAVPALKVISPSTKSTRSMSGLKTPPRRIPVDPGKDHDAVPVGTWVMAYDWGCTGTGGSVFGIFTKVGRLSLLQVEKSKGHRSLRCQSCK